MVGIVRKLENVQELYNKVCDEKGKLYPVECDLGEPKEIIATFKWIDDNIGPISILVNNAALLIPSTLTGNLI